MPDHVMRHPWSTSGHPLKAHQAAPNHVRWGIWAHFSGPETPVGHFVLPAAARWRRDRLPSICRRAVAELFPASGLLPANRPKAKPRGDDCETPLAILRFSGLRPRFRVQ